MANATVTYTFTNGTTADADQVSQNFTDIINATSDGTKDFSINALTCAGSATLNGNVTLGNASGDDLTVNASIASSIPVKTNETYDVGSSSTGLRVLYLGENSQTLGLAANTAASADYVFRYPANAGTQGYGLETDGSGNHSYKPMQTDTSAKTADYTVTDGDGIRTILMTTSTTDRTVTLPTAADNSGRYLTIKKVDSATGKCTVDGEGSETIDGATTYVLVDQNESVTIVCDGTSWHIVDKVLGESTVNLDTPNGHGSTNTKIRIMTNSTVVGNAMTYASTSAAGASITINKTGIYSLFYTDQASGTIAQAGFSINSSNLTTNLSGLSTSERLVFAQNNVSGGWSYANYTGKLTSGDVVRPHTDGDPDNNTGIAKIYAILIG